jgi:hypothetical protein
VRKKLRSTAQLLAHIQLGVLAYFGVDLASVGLQDFRVDLLIGDCRHAVCSAVVLL